MLSSVSNIVPIAADELYFSRHLAAFIRDILRAAWFASFRVHRLQILVEAKLVAFLDAFLEVAELHPTGLIVFDVVSAALNFSTRKARLSTESST